MKAYTVFIIFIYFILNKILFIDLNILKKKTPK